VEILNEILDNNKSWVEKINKEIPDLFTKLAKQQSPKYLWIGCSDSRVPETTITNMLPGDIFVHRNIANLVVPSDLSCLSVIQYAVEVLEVDRIIVCGHYGCGGVKASMEDKDHGFIDNWLNNIKNVQKLNSDSLDPISSEEEKFNRLCELNVKEQVNNLCNTTIVKNARNSGKKFTVHGLIYNIANGQLKDLNISC
jgi:carbonic anhydrase